MALSSIGTFLNLLPKDLCDEERPPHEGQGVEENDPTANVFINEEHAQIIFEINPAANAFMRNPEKEENGGDLGRKSTH